MNAAIKIIFDLISPTDSGCLAIDSIAFAPIQPIPSPAPITANHIPIATIDPTMIM